MLLKHNIQRGKDQSKKRWRCSKTTEACIYQYEQKIQAENKLEKKSQSMTSTKNEM